jgi:hypothetical protein
MPVSIPDAYLGVWKRALLRTPEFEDTTTTVFWLQTSTWHGDIRIPTSRPSCAGRRSLHDCTHEELLGLARQQGFSGVTRVEGDLCSWLRRADFQPPSRFEDIGRMEFESSERLFEHGVHQEYFDIWERLPFSTGNEYVSVTFPPGEEESVSCPTRILLATGNYFIQVRPRTMPLPQADSLMALDSDDASLRSVLDFEISFGTRGPGAWTITHSTLPWLEGERLLDRP